MLVEPEDTHERQDEEEAHTKAILDERSGLPMQQCPGSTEKVWQQRVARHCYCYLGLWPQPILPR